MMVALAVGSQVRLMEGNECVGTGVLADGDVLHGHTIPRNFRKVMVETVKPGVPPKLNGAFEDDFLCSGQFTVWPFNQMECM